MPSQWEFYWASVDGRQASLSVDLSLRAAAPLRDKPHLLRVQIKLRAPNEGGWPTADERAALDDFEDRLVETLVDGEAAVHAGRMFRDGLCAQYFYAPKDVDALGEAIGRVFESFPGYEGSCDGFEDVEWENYLQFLYPNPMGQQFIRTRRMVEHLKDAGVDLDAPRDVRHFAIFPDAGGRTSFAAKIAEQGYAILAEIGPGELAFGRSEPPRFGELNAAVERLFLLAQEHGGAYSRWDCPRLEETLALRRRFRLDEGVFRQMVEAGFDFTKTHTLDHVFVAPTEAAALAIAGELSGFKIDLQRSEDRWVVQASKPGLLKFETVHAETCAFYRLARRHGASYDGWGAGKE